MKFAKLIILALITIASNLYAGALDKIMEDISPDVKKWASVVQATGDPNKPSFQWFHYRNSAHDIDFWPASTIKIYTVVAALEYLNELNMPTDTTLSYEHYEDNQWYLDSARAMREMISEVFRRSSNEDYTLLLRFVGIDRINTKFLIPERGFPHSALMRDYVSHRPPTYVNEEPQRITLYANGHEPVQVKHEWSGTSYSKQRGATIISETTGNCTSTKELAECLRRIMFHHVIPPKERYHLTDEQIKFVIEGGRGLTGLECGKNIEFKWEEPILKVFPNARIFYKGGSISTYTLDLICVDDIESKTKYVFATAAQSGNEETIRKMSLQIAEWIKRKTSASSRSPSHPTQQQPSTSPKPISKT